MELTQNNLQAQIKDFFNFISITIIICLSLSTWNTKKQCRHEYEQRIIHCLLFQVIWANL